MICAKNVCFFYNMQAPYLVFRGKRVVQSEDRKGDSFDSELEKLNKFELASKQSKISCRKCSHNPKFYIRFFVF